ncbi:MAG: RluA family pseudouridine synthase [Calditrichaeota bacterium]|nr:MAG: RluA family pseudouridine synthase [Calditrichota bacterium]
MPLVKIHKLTVPESAGGQRLDRWLAEQFPQKSRAFFQKLIQQGNVQVDGKPARSSHRLEPGEQVVVTEPEEQPPILKPEPIALDIVYLDRHLVVVNKPAGLVVHPGAGQERSTLVHALLYQVGTLSPIGAPLRAGIVHRLDKDTSGLLVVARSELAHRHLARQFAEKRAHREYLALVWHAMANEMGRIETFVNRSKRDRKLFTVAPAGKLAITEYHVLERFEFCTLLRLHLQTGRTHQIRIHLKHLNHPVFGDPQYGGRRQQLAQLRSARQRQRALKLLGMIHRQALHAYKLGLVHPESGQWMEWEAPPPADFQNVLEELRSDATE